MRRKLLLLLLCFTGFYYLLHLVYDAPNILQGRTRFAVWPADSTEALRRIADIALSFLFTLLPYLLFHWFHPRRKTILAAVLTLAVLPLLFFLPYWVASAILAEEQTLLRFTRLRNFFSANVFYFILYTLFGAAFYFVRYAYYKELQQKEMELQNRSSELSFLRSQINPHFLFNSLNNIYSLVYLQSPHSLEAIAGFSDLLRYMLYDTQKDVELARELAYIKQYIALQQLRHEQPIHASLVIKGDTERVFIPPLILIPFVENAFKHGSYTQGSEGISIVVNTDKKQTSFFCQNKVSAEQKDATGGIGLQNVKRRLELLYPGRHQLVIIDDPVFFIVKLELNHA